MRGERRTRRQPLDPFLEAQVDTRSPLSAKMTSLGTSSQSVTEYVVRVPKNTPKKYNIMAFNAADKVNFTTWHQAKMERDLSNKKIYQEEEMPESGAGSEFNRKLREEARRKKYGIVLREFKPEDQPWILKVNGKAGRKFKGVKKGGVTENASYYIFTQCPDGAFEAFPVSNWYNFTPVAKHRTLTAEEAEEEWERRNKVLNHFTIMQQRRRKDQDDEEEEKEKKTKKKSSELKIHDLEDDLEMSSDESELSDADGEKAAKPQKKTPLTKKKKKKKGSDDEAFEDSDDGDFEGQEVDYMSDGSSSQEEAAVGKPKVTKEEDGPKGIDEASESSEESEEEKPAEEKEEEEEEKKAPTPQEKKKKKDSSDESETSEESDIDSEASSALFMAVDSNQGVMPGFKRCLSCQEAIPVSDGHPRCLRCLGEAHVPQKCTHCLNLKARSRKACDLKLKPQMKESLLRPASDPGPGTPPGQRSPSAPAAPHSLRATKRKSTDSSRKDTKKRAPRSPTQEPRKRKRSPARSVALAPTGVILSTYDAPGTSGIVDAGKSKDPKRARLDKTAPSDNRGQEKPKASKMEPTSHKAPGTLAPPAGHSAECRATLALTRPSAPAPTQLTPTVPKTPQEFRFPKDGFVSETPESPPLRTGTAVVHAKPTRSPSPSRTGPPFSSGDEEENDAYSVPSRSCPSRRGAAQLDSSARRRYQEPRGDPTSWYGHPWVPPFMPVPPQWPCWDPWAAYRQQFSRPPDTQREKPRHSPSSSVSRPPEPDGESVKEEEERLKQEATPAPNIPSSSAAKTVVPPPPLSADDDFRQRQELFRRIADSLHIPLEEPRESQCLFLDILPTSTKFGLPIVKTLLDAAKAVWQTPATIPPTCKRAEKKYFVPSKDMEFLSSLPTPNSMVVLAVNERERLRLNNPYDKDWKKLDLLGRKAHSSAALQFRIANYEAFVSRYNHTNYSKLNEFIQYIPEDKRKQFQAVVTEGQLLARTALQASLDAADAAARSIATAAVMRRVSWLRLSGLPKYIQATVEDFPFEGSNLFADKTDDYFRSIRDARETLRALRVSTPVPRRRQNRYHATSRSRTSAFPPPQRDYDPEMTETSQM
ncbi:general transcription factor IIF subunit 1 isoform X2 [Emys orbicularis]|uniref:general transcription factor IIF subunit 1 isoform X2 n=1 Tax=Emys orbicularis TaxID=82168 RepID=UPI0031FCFE99